MVAVTSHNRSMRTTPGTAKAGLGVAVLLLVAAGGRPEVFVRPRNVTSAQLTAMLGDARIDPTESRTPAAAAVFAALAQSASEQMLCAAAARSGGRTFMLRVTVLPPSGASGAPASYNHPVEVSSAGAEGWVRVGLIRPGGSPIATYRCRA